MRVLHTSDWHLGHHLYGQKRHEEQASFLDWLLLTLKEQSVDILLICGDIFDTTTPSTRTQEQYFRFLASLPGTGVKHTVIIAGNHDSASLIKAPEGILKALNIHVIGNVSDPVEDCVLLLKEDNGIPLAIVCAIPYLRDRDLRRVDDNESIKDKEVKLREGISLIYQRAGLEAMRFLQECSAKVPVLVLGHLFAAGGQTIADDGVRDLYVGSLAHVLPSVFPDAADYVALGHLHQAQKVGGCEHIRYSGAPIAMGFNEAGANKAVLLVDLKDKVSVRPLLIPCFQKLQLLRGRRDELIPALQNLVLANEPIWLEVQVIGLAGGLNEELREMVAGTRVEILRLRLVGSDNSEEMVEEEPRRLEELTPEEVFRLRLAQESLEPEQVESLLTSFREILFEIHHADSED